jgi:VWFA-related protein
MSAVSMRRHLFGVVVLLASVFSAAVFVQARYAGRPVVDVLGEMRDAGVNVVFSSELVRPEMHVAAEPRATSRTDILKEILNAHGLDIRDGVAGAMLVVRRAPLVRRVPSQPAARVAANQITAVSSGPAFQPQDAPTFRTGTTLVELTVVVQDEGGNPITDLTKQEITVTEDGRRREVAFLQFEGHTAFATQVAPPPPLPTNTFTNRVERIAGPVRSVIAIVMDVLNTDYNFQLQMRESVLKYLDTVQPGTRVGIYRLRTELEPLHPFTEDVASARESVKKLIATKFPVTTSNDVRELYCLATADPTCPDIMLSPSITQYFRAEADRRRRLSLAALESLGDHLAGVRGRKSVVWMGSGVSMSATTGCFGGMGAHGGLFNYTDQVRRTAERLASQGAVLYPTEPDGLILGTASPRGPGQLKPVNGRLPDCDGGPTAGTAGNVYLSLKLSALSNWYPESTRNLLAEVTGGRAMKDATRLRTGMEWAELDGRSSYSAGFYSPLEADGRFHRIEVKVNRRGARVVHQRGYSATRIASRPLEWLESELLRAVRNPLGSAGVRLDVRIARAGNAAVDVAIEIPAEDLHFARQGDRRVADLDVVIAEEAPGARIRYEKQRADVALPAGDAAKGAMVRHTLRANVQPGTPAFRILVRDRLTGKYGTIDVPVIR